MELASGKVRYEFSGPGAYGWFAAFTPDGSAFLAGQLFGGTLQVWPTAHAPKQGRAAPKPTGSVALPKGTPLAGLVSSAGHIAVTMADGAVVVRALRGRAPQVAPLPGKGATTAAFTASGSAIAAVRGGKAYVVPLR